MLSAEQQLFPAELNQVQYHAQVLSSQVIFNKEHLVLKCRVYIPPLRGGRGGVLLRMVYSMLEITLSKTTMMSPTHHTDCFENPDSVLGKAALHWMKRFSSQGILITDERLVIHCWNFWMETHSSRPSSDVLGLHLLEAFPDLKARRLDRLYHDALAGHSRVLAPSFHKYLLFFPLSSQSGPAFMLQSAQIISLKNDAGDVVGTLTAIEDVTERIHRETALMRESEINQAVAILSGKLISYSTIEEISQLVVEQAKRLTGSRYGFVSYGGPETGYTHSEPAEFFDTPQFHANPTLSKNLHQIWEWVLQHRKPVMFNDMSREFPLGGAPAGRTPIHRMLSAPALFKDRLMGQLSLANSDKEYTEDDLEMAQRLSDLYALAVYRWRIEIHLQQEKDRIQKYLDIAGVILMVLDTGGVIRLVNKEGCRLLGLPENEILGQNWFTRFIPSKDQETFWKLFLQAMSGETTVSVYRENAIVTASGEIKIIAWRNVLLWDETGRITGTLSSGEDITRRKEMEERLVQSRDEWENTFNTVPDLIAVIDTHHRIVQINKSMADRLGVSPEDVVGAQCCALVHGTPFPPDFCPHKTLLTDRAAHEADIYESRLGGYFHISVTPRYDRNGNLIGSVHVAHDINQRKLAEDTAQAMALTDELTGLYNRRGFMALAEQQLRTIVRLKKGAAVIFADLDGMKHINDTLGHQQGDEALKETSRILKKTFRGSDIIARLGGDEFVVLAMENGNFRAELLIDRLQTNIQSANAEGSRPFALSISTGISRFNPENVVALETLLSRADALMYENKQKKKLAR